jgi:hypothetical protein
LAGNFFDFHGDLHFLRYTIFGKTSKLWFIRASFRIAGQTAVYENQEHEQKMRDLTLFKTPK